MASRHGIMTSLVLEMPPPGRTSGQPTLLERIAQGDPQAVSELVDRYGPLVHSLARSQLDAEAAEDVAQDVFLALWRNADRFDPSLSSESAYIATVTRRRVIDQRRGLGRRPRADEIDESLPEDRPEDDPVDVADEARAAHAALARLPRAQREVLRLSIVEGLTHAEIAAETALPLGTVKSHARRGLERVREILARGRGPAPEAGA
jgi:RNA polymerase sigma-70 factor (ECF subfamily)